MPLKIKMKKNITTYVNVNIERNLKSKIGAFITLEIEETMPHWKEDKNSVFVKTLPADTAKLFFFLAAGERDAAMYVADSFNRDMGTKADEETKILLVDLAYVIGQKLGDTACINAISDGPEPEEKVIKCADLCVKLMKINKQEIAASINRGEEFTEAEWIGYAKQFDDLVKQNLGVSFIDNIGPYYPGDPMLNDISNIDYKPKNFNFLNNTNYNDYHYNSNEEHKEYAADYHENNDQELAGITPESACCIIS